MSVCKHYNKIKPETIGNLLKDKPNLLDCHNPKHNISNIPKASDLWFCLTCGHNGCGRESESKCSLEHSKKAQHSMCINPSSLVIWCYPCDRSIDETLEMCNNKGESDKISKFKEKTTQLFFKFNKETKRSMNTVLIAPGDKDVVDAKEIGKSEISAPTSKAIFGLKNIGNTCFFNSVMQCLNATRPLTDKYLDLKNFDVSDLKDDSESADAPGPSNDDWITVSKPKQQKNKGGKGGGKGGYKGKNSMYTPSRSSFINICKNFQDFLVEARGRKDSVYDPSHLFGSISHLFSRFRGYSQQDAQELLRNFLDGLSTCEEKRFTKTELAQSRKGFKHRLTEIEKIFGSYLCNYVKCQDCKYVNRTFDFCLDIVLNIDKEKERPRIVEPKKKKKKGAQKEETHEEEEHKEEQQPNGAPVEEEKVSDANNENHLQPSKYRQIDSNEIKDTAIPYFDQNLYELYEPNIEELTKHLGKSNEEGKEESITLEEAMKEFTAVEILNRQKNFYKCENCEKEKHVSSGSARRFFLYDPPPVLTLVLKRYRQIGIGRFEKVNTQVKFNETLILDPFVLLPVRKSEAEEIEKNNNKVRFEYELYGVVVQSGNLNGGHYVSYTKHIINGEEVWYYHSDTTFKALKKETVLKTQPYILFYTLKQKSQTD